MPLANPGRAGRAQGPDLQRRRDRGARCLHRLAGPRPGHPHRGAVRHHRTPEMALGGALFRANCASCHDFSGKGGALTDGKFAPSLTETTRAAIYAAMLTGPQNMPVFRDFHAATPRTSGPSSPTSRPSRSSRTPAASTSGAWPSHRGAACSSSSASGRSSPPRVWIGVKAMSDHRRHATRARASRATTRPSPGPAPPATQRHRPARAPSAPSGRSVALFLGSRASQRRRSSSPIVADADRRRRFDIPGFGDVSALQPRSSGCPWGCRSCSSGRRHPLGQEAHARRRRRRGAHELALDRRGARRPPLEAFEQGSTRAASRAVRSSGACCCAGPGWPALPIVSAARPRPAAQGHAVAGRTAVVDDGTRHPGRQR